MPVTVNEDFLSGVVNYIEATGEMLSKQSELEEKIEEFGPAVVDTLIKRGFIDENGRTEAIAATRDPLKVLESLKKTAEEVDRRKKAEETEPMGKGEDTPATKVAEASADVEVTDNWGRRASREKEAADRRFIRRFINSA
jgi:predicted DNA-binding transcriptional regulator